MRTGTDPPLMCDPAEAVPLAPVEAGETRAPLPPADAGALRLLEANAETCRPLPRGAGTLPRSPLGDGLLRTTRGGQGAWTLKPRSEARGERKTLVDRCRGTVAAPRPLTDLLSLPSARAPLVVLRKKVLRVPRIKRPNAVTPLVLKVVSSLLMMGIWRRVVCS